MNLNPIRLKGHTVELREDTLMGGYVAFECYRDSDRKLISSGAVPELTNWRARVRRWCQADIDGRPVRRRKP